MKPIMQILAGGVLGLGVQATVAEEIGYSFGADLAYKQLDFRNILTSGSVSQEIVTKADLWNLALGPAVSYGRYFASLTAERSLGNSADPNYSSSSGFTGVVNTSRSENALTVGASLWGGLSVFAGVMDNETERFAGGSYTTFRDKGPFLGLAYSHNFKSGSLAATVAYANAKSEFKQESLGFSTSIGDGDLTGTSFSLMWVAPLGDLWTGRVGYRGTRYSADLTGSAYLSGVFQTSFTRESKQDYDALVIGVTRAF